ncbi:hypothetical protein IWW36_004523 [Coemansia brasiliensis]|uniref:Uncharacterized protein n=1 Tax=Coemansia brasiliensis TaxID=2650707 RepID=A0A9W8LYP8_9FUNG|nr:hypothetical protein IWW36_004523 [Coemansia brasiliensis]
MNYNQNYGYEYGYGYGNSAGYPSRNYPPPQQYYAGYSQNPLPPQQSYYQGYEQYSHPSVRSRNSLYSSPIPPHRSSSFGPQNDRYSTTTYDTLSQYSATTRPKTEYDYDKIETSDRGLKDYLMKTSYDEYGTEQSRLSKSRFTTALALGGAAIYAVKKGYERYKEKQLEGMYPAENTSCNLSNPGGSQCGV